MHSHPSPIRNEGVLSYANNAFSFIILYVLSILMTFFLITQVFLSPIRFFIPSLYNVLESHLVSISVNFEKVLTMIVSQGHNRIFLYTDSTDLLHDTSTSTFSSSQENNSNSNHTFIALEHPEDLFNLTGNALVISNHVGTADWIALFNFFDHYLHSASKIRFMMKEQHRGIPIIGTAAYLRRMIFLKKDLEKDKQTILESLEQFKQIDGDCWILLYPEGTFVTPTTLPILHKVQTYARENNLPVLEHVLNPRTKGVELCFHENHRHMFDYVISVTVAYSMPYDVKIGEAFAPTLVNFFRKQADNHPSNGVHVHLRVLSARNFQESNQDISEWVKEEFYYKEEILRHFRKFGKFPGRRTYLPLTARDLIYFIGVILIWIFAFNLLSTFLLGKIFLGLIFAVSFLLCSFMVWYDHIHQNHLLIPNKNKKED